MPTDPRLTAALAKVPAGKKGRAEVTLNLESVKLDVGYKPKPWLDVTGFAVRPWSTKKWDAGARVGLTW